MSVVVLGGGVDGLCAALRLARAGRAVTLLEPGSRVGGLAAEREFHPGYRVPGILHDVTGARRAALSELGLEAHGLEWRRERRARLVVSETEGTLRWTADVGRADGPLNAHDGKAWREWTALRDALRPIVASLVDAPVPDPFDAGIASLLDLARRAVDLRRLGERTLHELLRVGPLAVSDWIEERFEDARLALSFAARATEIEGLGPRAAGTTALLLLRETVEETDARGGPAALVAALEAAARAERVEVRCGVVPERIEVDAGRVRAVTLADGTVLETDAVVSGLGVAQTLLDLVEPARLPLRIERDARRARTRAHGDVGLVWLALDAPPPFRGAEPAAPVERAFCARDVAHLERVAEAVALRRLPDDVWLSVSVPSVASPGLAPAGGHVVSAFVHGCPAALDGGWTDARREELGDLALAALERAAPGVTARTLARTVLTPADLARESGVDGGHLHGGPMTLDNLWLLRPSLGLSRGTTGIEGLTLAGPGVHPGGFVLGPSGRTAADLVLSA